MDTNEKPVYVIGSPEEVDRGPSDVDSTNQTENESQATTDSMLNSDSSIDNEYHHDDAYEDSSYVDSITSNDSKTALLQPNIDTEKEVVLNSVITFTEVIHQRDSFYDMDFQHLDLDGVARSRTGTMNGLLESPAYFDAMNCPTSDHRLIARVCRNAVLSMSQDIVPKLPVEIKVDLIENKKQTFDDEEYDTGDFSSIGRHMKNLFILGLSVTLVNIANSLRNLQSSINHSGGIGLYSLAANYVGFMIFSLFSPFIVQRFRPKRCLVVGIIPYILYVLANLHPTFLVLVPFSFLQGVGSALLWNAISTYTTYLARSYALQNDARTVHIASQYFGIVFFFLQFSVVAGNMISSVVLMTGLDANSTNIPKEYSKTFLFGSDQNNSLYSNNIVDQLNSTDLFTESIDPGRVCGSRYCHSSQRSSNSGVGVGDDTKYVLFGIYGLSAIFALVVAAYLLDPLKPYRTTRATAKVVVKQLWSVLKCTVDRRFLLLFILFAYSNMQNAFVTGEITKAFVTCPVGMHMVGLTMICFGVCAGLTSYIGGYLNKHVGHLTLITAAGVSNLVLLIGMSIWRPGQDQIIVCFIVMGCWGLGDGIWFSQTSSLISEVFPDCIEDAFAAQRVLQGLGGAVCFSYATSLCMMTKMFIMGVVCLLGLICYVIQEILSRRQRAKTENVEKEIYA